MKNQARIRAIAENQTRLWAMEKNKDQVLMIEENQARLRVMAENQARLQVMAENQAWLWETKENRIPDQVMVEHVGLGFDDSRKLRYYGSKRWQGMQTWLQMMRAQVGLSTKKYSQWPATVINRCLLASLDKCAQYQDIVHRIGDRIILFVDTSETGSFLFAVLL